MKKEDADRVARRDKKRSEQEEKIAAKREEQRKFAELKEANKDKIELLKQDYYLRKAKRERWEAFRAESKTRGNFNDYYRGWDLFEDDPDEELFSGDNPAAVQDQSAFDAMAKDVEERTALRKAHKAAAEKEKDAGNAAFKAGQPTEAIACYSRAIDFFKGDKAVYSNRALAHIKLRNFLSAVEDCSRAINISQVLDEDHERRPPPPPLVKAYVRRATACIELERYDEAGADLETAAGLAVEADLVEIRRHQKALRQEVAAAAKEAKALQAAAGGDGAAKGSKEQLERLRDLLDELATAGAETAARPTEQVLAELAGMLDSPASCVGVRQAGGIARLVALLGSAHAEAAARLLMVACYERRNQHELHVCGGTTAILRALRAAQPTAAEEARKAEAAGGSAAPVRAPISGKAAAALVVTPAQMAPQLRLLALCCVHDSVRDAVRPLAAGEGAYERLTRLLQAAVGEQAAPTPPEAAQGAAALLAALSHGVAGRKALRPVAAPLCEALVPLLAPSQPLEVCESVVGVVGNLSADAKCRRAMASLGAVPALLALLGRAQAQAQAQAQASQPARASGALVPNTLGALHNVALLDGALEEMASAATAAQLLPLLEGDAPPPPPSSSPGAASANTFAASVHRPGTVSVARRAASVLAKVVVVCRPAVELLLERGAVPRIAAMLKREAEALHGEGAGKPGGAAAVDDEEPVIEEVDADGETASDKAKRAAAEAAAAAGDEDEDEDEDEQELTAEKESLLNALVRLAAACAQEPRGARDLCEAGVLPVLALLIGRADSNVQGNAALCVADSARDEKALAILGALPALVPKLLAIAHNGSGQAQKNSAIALGRLAKNPHCLKAIRDNNGIEILARQMSKMGMAPGGGRSLMSN